MKINTDKFFLIAGPCVVESKEICFEIAEQLVAITTELNIPFVFKASFKKANRSKLDSFTTIGEEKALQILADVKSRFNIPILTDVHETTDCELVKEIVDVIQIPAFLCRQTELLIAAAKTGKTINLKKGQFVNAEMMQFAAEKIVANDNKNIWLTERGTMFGYNDLIVDFRNIQQMKSFGFPVIFDATHSVQQPNASTGTSGGKPEFIDTLAKCAIVSGADGIFLETHPKPTNAMSDGANMLALHAVKKLLEKLVPLKKI
ncbi:MAG TPA: 3-deoxy-8-phosphooctulonate synthase [Chitinophagales bacterium]|jgi:2-dehydro-3-deoxyphosphooctonate aldolase (KDO 8-P synthase)|nr:3-deoxy-8-phosphooctulonate synthase [Chitinophagales bacterium]HQG37682.1 3-deoxy-8-phosphooctulonate synthase [Chitinophagales bacterium]